MRIVEGTIEDYDRLAPLHYRSERPATRTLVLVARRHRETRGVLVVSRPTLNGRWREQLWADLAPGPDRGEHARRLNRELRTISRVVVDPRFRGLGVGTSLVRAALARAETPRTEAVAAMGVWCSFFERAGMRGVRLAPSPRDARLRTSLDDLGVPHWALVDPSRAGVIVRDPRVVASLRRWARASRSGRRSERDDPARIARRAARTVGVELVAYAHDRAHAPGPPSEGGRTAQGEDHGTHAIASERGRARGRPARAPG